MWETPLTIILWVLIGWCATSLLSAGVISLLIWRSKRHARKWREEMRQLRRSRYSTSVGERRGK